MKLQHIFERNSSNDEFDTAKAMWNEYDNLTSYEDYAIVDLNDLLQAISKHENNFDDSQLKQLHKMVDDMKKLFTDPTQVKLYTPKLSKNVLNFDKIKFVDVDANTAFDYVTKMVDELEKARVTFDEYRDLEARNIRQAVKDQAEDEYSRHGVRRSDF